MIYDCILAADSGSAGYDPCIDNEVEAYLNRGDVQAALHANDSAHALPYPWSDCNHRIHYNWCANGIVHCLTKVKLCKGKGKFAVLLLQ